MLRGGFKIPYWCASYMYVSKVCRPDFGNTVCFFHVWSHTGNFWLSGTQRMCQSGKIDGDVVFWWLLKDVLFERCEFMHCVSGSHSEESEYSSGLADSSVWGVKMCCQHNKCIPVVLCCEAHSVAFKNYLPEGNCLSRPVDTGEANRMDPIPVQYCEWSCASYGLVGHVPFC